MRSLPCCFTTTWPASGATISIPQNAAFMSPTYNTAACLGTQARRLNPIMGRRMHQVVILGGGFGGLYAAKALRRAPVDLTVIDRRNFHLFQPLLYQVATGSLSPGQIASPLRAILHKQRNTRVLLGNAVDLDVQRHRLILSDDEIPYDTLVVATGS